MCVSFPKSGEYLLVKIISQSSGLNCHHVYNLTLPNKNRDMFLGSAGVSTRHNPCPSVA